MLPWPGTPFPTIGKESSLIGAVLLIPWQSNTGFSARTAEGTIAMWTEGQANNERILPPGWQLERLRHLSPRKRLLDSKFDSPAPVLSVVDREERGVA